MLRESEYEQQNIRNIQVEQKKKLESVRLSKEEVQKLIVKKEQSARQLSGLISSMVRNDIVKKEEKSWGIRIAREECHEGIGNCQEKTIDGEGTCW